MLKVGLTGGIGAGKSVVARVFEVYGYPVFYSDNVSKNCVNTDPEVRSALIKLFGSSLYENDVLNREMLAEIIFSDDQARNQVNAIIHPAVRLAFARFAEEHQNASFVVNEAAILFETGAYQQFDKTILVTAPTGVRLKRVKERDGSNDDQIQARIDMQWSDEQKIPLADYVIVNDGKLALLPQIDRIIDQLISSKSSN